MDTTNTSLTAAQAQGLTADSLPWLSCDACFDRMDVCVDALFDEDFDGDAFGEPMRVHLARCPACCEEAESLAALVAGDHGMNATRAVHAFRSELSRHGETGAERKSRLARLFRRLSGNSSARER